MLRQNVQTTKHDIQFNFTMIPIIFNPFMSLNCLNPVFCENTFGNLNPNLTNSEEEIAKNFSQEKQSLKLNYIVSDPHEKTFTPCILKDRSPKSIKPQKMLSQRNPISVQGIQEPQNGIYPEKEFKKMNWTPEEDQKILEMVSLFGKQWKHISQHFPERNSKQIRERYLNYLRPNISHEKWTAQEDLELIELIKKYGRQWKVIQKIITTRSQNQLKNRFYGKLKKIFEKNQTFIPN